MRRLRAVIAAVLLTISGLIVTVSPVGAACSTAWAVVDDGSGHQTVVGSAGSCSAPQIYWFNMHATPAPSGCVGTFGISHSDWGDCINSVKFKGFPAGTVLRVYRDINFGGGSVGFACQNVWYNLGNYNMADQASSMKTVSGSGTCT